ncbi:hypothetical protein T492DRAFT_860452, partial [Pavlovales sp. CCMP2436]
DSKTLGPLLSANILPPVLVLLTSPLLQGAAVAKMQALLRTVVQFMSQMSGGELNTQLLALHCLGQIGRQLDLSAQQATLLPALTATFDAPAEELKTAGTFFFSF